jgi:hypothetical protein
MVSAVRQKIDPGFGTSIYYAVWPVAPNDVWTSLGAASNSVAHWNGASWTREPLPAGVIFQCLWGSGANDVWGVSSTKVGHWAGSAWAMETPPGVTQSLWGAHGVGGDLWLVGDGAMILHRD